MVFRWSKEPSHHLLIIRRAIYICHTTRIDLVISPNQTSNPEVKLLDLKKSHHAREKHSIQRLVTSLFQAVIQLMITAQALPMDEAMLKAYVNAVHVAEVLDEPNWEEAPSPDLLNQQTAKLDMRHQASQ